MPFPFNLFTFFFDPSSDIGVQIIERIENMKLSLTENQTTALIVAAIICGIIATAMMVYTAILNKKHLSLGIAAAVSQIVGFFAGAQMVIAYTKVDFNLLLGFGAGSTTEEAMSSAFVALIENLKEYYPSWLPFVIWGIIFFACTTITFAYITKLTAVKPKAFATFAFLLCILRWLFLSPVDSLHIILTLLGKGAMQQSALWNFSYFAMAMLIPSLLLIQAFLANTAKYKALNEKKSNMRSDNAEIDEAFEK